MKVETFLTMILIIVSIVVCILLTWIDPNLSIEKGFPFLISRVAVARVA